MTASAPKGRNKTYPKYHCPKCKGQHMNYDVAYVNEEFLNYIKDFKMSRDIKEALKTAIKLNLEDRIKNNSGVKEKLTQRLTQIDAERKEVVRKNIRVL